MPEYTIQDAETGRELVVEGATPPTPEDMAFLFAEAYRREGITTPPIDLAPPPETPFPLEERVAEDVAAIPPEAPRQLVDPEDELGILGTFTGGASRGFSRLGSTFTDIIPAIAGSAVGNEEYALEQLAEAEEKRRLSELENPTQFESYKEVEGVGDFSRFVSQVVGEQIGNIGLVVGSGLAATAAAATAPVSVPAGIALIGGTALGSYALNAPEVFENIYQETGETAPGVALLFGAGAAALDSVLPYGIARSMGPGWKTGVVKTLLERSGMSPGVLRSGTAGLFAGLGVEGITEGGQEAISIAAERFVDDNPEAFGSREWDRIMESVVQGAIAGGSFGLAGGGIQGVRESNDAKKIQQILDDTGDAEPEVGGDGSVIDGGTGDPIVPAESGGGLTPEQERNLEAAMDADFDQAETPSPEVVEEEQQSDFPDLSDEAEVERIRNMELEPREPADTSVDEVVSEAAEIGARAETPRETFYHVTKAENVPEIQRTGLRKRTEGMEEEWNIGNETPNKLFSFTDKKDAELWVGRYTKVPREELRIIAFKDDVRNVQKDQSATVPYSAVMSDSDIPPSDIIEITSPGKPPMASDQVRQVIFDGAGNLLPQYTPQGVEEAAPPPRETFYHVTTVDNVPAIEQTGLRARTEEEGTYTTLGGETPPQVYAFSDKVEADRWASKMSYDLNLPIENLKIVSFESEVGNVQKDMNTEMQLKYPSAIISNTDIPPSNIVEIAVPGKAPLAKDWGSISVKTVFDGAGNVLPEYTPQGVEEASIDQADTIEIPFGIGVPGRTTTGPRYWYHDPGGRGVSETGDILPYTDPSFTNELLPESFPATFKGERNPYLTTTTPPTQAIYLSQDPNYRPGSIKIDASKLDLALMRRTGQIEGHAFYAGVIPKSAQVVEEEASIDQSSPKQSVGVGDPTTEPNSVFLKMNNARQAIDYIKKNTVSKLFRNLANRLAPFMGNTRIVIVTDPDAQIDNTRIRDWFKDGAHGVYDPVTDTIYLDSKQGITEEVVLHEATHKGTVEKITIYLNNNPGNRLTNKEVAALDGLQNLKLEAYKSYKAKERAGTLTQQEKNLYDAGAFTTLHEFIAYGRTNPAMQQFLNGYPGADGKSTLFGDFVEFLRQLFNIPASQKKEFMEFIKLSDALLVPETEANTGQVLAAKKIASKKENRIKKLIQAIRNANGGARGTLSNMGKLMKETRDAVANIDVLRGGFEWMNENVVKALSKILTTTDITRWIDDVIPGVHSINRDIQNFTKARNQALATLHERIQPWVKFAKDFAQEAKWLSEVMHESTILQVDVSAWATAEEAIANDEVLHGNNKKGADKKVGKYEKLLDPEIHPLTQQDIEAEIQQRIDDIERLYKKWNDVGKVDNKKGHEIYKMAKAAYRETYDKYHRLLIERIKASSANPATQEKLIDFINLRYEVHHNLKVYFPLMRYGNYWITVKRSDGPLEFYMRESAADRNNLLNEIVTDISGIDRTQDRAQHEAAKTQLFNDGVIEQGDKLREGFNKAIAGSTQELKDLFATIDSLQEKTENALEGGMDEENFKAPDFDLLKDELYQMWLHTQQPDALRRKFIHRKRDNVLGYAEDALRNFVNSQATSATQLARFEFTPKLDLSIAAAQDSLKGRAPSQGQQKYGILVEEIINRARTELNPATPEGMDWGAVASIGNQVAFVYMLTAPKSALIQFTQVPIVGIPALVAKGYGKRNVMRVLGGYLKVLGRFGKEGVMDGTVSVVNSEYIENHPLKDWLQAGFQTAMDLGILNVTYSADLSARRKSDTDQFDSLGKKGWRGFVDMMGFLFHHSERLSREIVFMSSLELELERLQRTAPNLNDAARLSKATQTAIDNTYEILFNYTLYEKPPIMKHPVGKIATQFLTYPLQMTSFLVRNFFGTVWPTIPRAERKAAATKFFGTIGMTTLFAGLVGVPGYTAIMGMAEGVREALRPDMDDEDADMWYDDNDEGNPLGKRNLDLWFREWWIPTMFGPNSDVASALGLTEEQAQLLARNVEMGPISALTDWNFGSSVTLDHLWFQDRVPSDDMKSAFQYFLFDTFGGPLGAMGTQIADGVQDVNEGNFDRGLEKFAPAFFRGPVKAWRLSQEGSITAGQRAQILDAEFYTMGKILGQTLNLQSTTEAEISKANFLAKRVMVEVQRERTKVLNQINLAFAKDMENPTPATQQAIDEALDAVDEYNFRNGMYPIDGDAISQSLTGRATTRAEADQGLVVPQDALAPWASDLVRRSRVN